MQISNYHCYLTCIAALSLTFVPQHRYDHGRLQEFFHGCKICCMGKILTYVYKTKLLSAKKFNIHNYVLHFQIIFTRIVCIYNSKYVINYHNYKKKFILVKYEKKIGGKATPLPSVEAHWYDTLFLFIKSI